MNENRIIKQLGYVGVGILLVYSLVVFTVFTHRRFRVPRGHYSDTLVGVYVVSTKCDLRIPDVLRSQGKLQFKSLGDGTASLTADGHKVLPLMEGKDGWYFSQDFTPNGAQIFPGIARNWNEGRVIKKGNIVVVDGCMLEKGLMFFVFPFTDERNWRIELSLTDP